MTANPWCQALGIDQPKLESVAGHREATPFSLLLVALLERGEPMTLADVAARFEEAGIADRSRALLSLQRCRPARAPVYRDGELYYVDPHDDELDLSTCAASFARSTSTSPAGVSPNSDRRRRP